MLPVVTPATGLAGNLLSPAPARASITDPLTGLLAKLTDTNTVVPAADMITVSPTVPPVILDFCWHDAGNRPRILDAAACFAYDESAHCSPGHSYGRPLRSSFFCLRRNIQDRTNTTGTDRGTFTSATNTGVNLGANAALNTNIHNDSTGGNTGVVGG